MMNEYSPLKAFPIPELINKLLNEVDRPREFRASYCVIKDGGVPQAPCSVFEALEIDDELLSPAAKETLDALEAAPASQEWANFKWRLTAFLYIQDIFDAPFYEGKEELIIFQQYYFYYESRTILAQSVLCGLNGFDTAAHALLRPFLEFSALQNYYHRLINDTRSYHALEKYFESGINPTWHTVLKKALPKDDFSQVIRYRMQSHLTGLSESTMHPYHPDHSSVQHKRPDRIHSLESLHFWAATDMALEAALWLYYVNFPLLFHPVNLLLKFGYNLPLGLLIDEQGGECIRRSLSQDDYQKFLEYSSQKQETIEMLKWYRAYPDLSNDKIRHTWNKDEGEYPGFWEGYGQVMARVRALKVGMALKRPSGKGDDLPQELFSAIRTLKGWKQLKARRHKEGN